MMGNKFEIQYEEENRLPHIILENVHYRNDDENKYYSAKFELFGHCKYTETYDTNGRVLQKIFMFSKE